MIFSNNLDKVKEYISLYGKIVFPILILGILILIVKYFITKDSKK
jgi:branched-subunit amino acid permease